MADKKKDIEFWWEEIIPQSQIMFFEESRGKDNPAIYVIRHGKTALNKMGGSTSVDKIRGWKDVPLDDEGLEQAVFIAEFLKHDNITKVYTSDMSRAKTVAVEICKERHVPMVTSQHFRPWNLGDMQGKPTTEVIPQMNDYIVNRQYDVVPGGESFVNFLDRYIPILKAMMADIEKGKMGSVALTTHYRNVKAAEAWFEGSGKGNSVNSSIMLTDSIPVGSMIKFIWDPDIKRWGYLILKCENNQVPFDAPNTDKT